MDESIDISQKLSEVHRKLKDFVNLNKKAEKDTKKAKKIETVLFRLKNRPPNIQKKGIGAVVDRIATDLIDETFNQLNEKRSSVEQLKEGLFRHEHETTKPGEGADDILESELAAIIRTIELKATKKISGDHLTGKDPLTIAIDELEEKTINAYADFIKEAFPQKAKNYEILKIEKRSGKRDVNGTSGTISIKVGVSNDWKKLFYLFKGITFSVKNYTGSSIHLGSTIYAKAILGSLYALGYTEKESENIFYNSIIKANDEKVKEEIANHFYHLQFGYELMGLGQGIKENDVFKEAKQVDFFIYNDPRSADIKVRSTAQMLLDQLELKNSQTKFKSSIQINKNKI